MTRQERRKRRRQRRRMQAGILLSLVLVLGLIIALRAGKEWETLEPEIPLAAERQKLTYIAPAPALPETAAEETPEEPEEPPVEPEPENRYAELHFSDEDVYILACLVYHEARGESFEGQVAVVEVVLNRMLSDYFPDTVEEVVFQKYGDVWQFSPAPYPYSAEPDKEQYLAVHTAIEEREHILSEDTVYFSTAPYNESVDMITRPRRGIARKLPRRGIKRGSPRKELRSRLGKTTPPRSLSRIKSGTRITPRRRCALYSSRKNIITSE